jgi:thiamine pyrophosphate-dependent acetolactate synthase large subunit-like protein
LYWNAFAIWGVRRVFGYPGDGINGITALGRQHEKDFVQVRHGEEAAFMASGHAKLTGEVGVCLATNGPGSCAQFNSLFFLPQCVDWRASRPTNISPVRLTKPRRLVP